MQSHPKRSSSGLCARPMGRPIALTACLAAIIVFTAPAFGDPVVPILEYDTTLEALNLTGGPFPISLASDPGNALGDSVDGYGFVNCTVAITLSSQRPVSPGPATLGKANAFVDSGEPTLFDADGVPAPIDPLQLDGQTFFVDSFFDVFFDITVTDVDSRPGRDFAGMPHGVTLPLIDNGPSQMLSRYQAVFDKDAPNFGMFPPPEAKPHIGFFGIEIPLGGDLNGNGVNDKVKITFASLLAGDSNRTFITLLPDGTVIDEFDAGMVIEGAILDETSDPPFTIGAELPSGLPNPSAFGGPATATSKLLNPILPEPTTLALLAAGAAILARRRRRK